MKYFFAQILSFVKRRWCVLTLFLVLAASLSIGSLRFPELKRLAIASLDKMNHRSHATESKAEPGHEDHATDVAPFSNAAPLKEEHDHEGEAIDSHADETGSTDEHGAETHNTESHSAEAHDELKSEPISKVKLSATAQANIGLRLAKVELQPFERTIAIQAMIVERPGRSSVHVSAPLTGVVSRIWPMQGESVIPGQKLFDLRLMHEEVVEAQSDLLRTAEELDVLRREIARLEEVTASGAVAGKTLLERKYEQQKLEAILRSQRQRLILHGLSQSQVDGILESRTLLSELTVLAPKEDSQPAAGGVAPIFQVQELKVAKGQHVKAGEPLCILAEHSELFIQGKAFEQDAAVLDKAATNECKVSAFIETKDSERQKVSDLNILYLDNKVEQESRAFLFYVQLPNKSTRDYQTTDGHHFSTWQFKPGQRVEMLVPVERWEDQIVLPLGALAQDGADYFVFQQEDEQFTRRPVKIEYRDQYSVVIANDGALTPGKSVIISGTYQVHLAMKNKAGGAPDPHAGHNH